MPQNQPEDHIEGTKTQGSLDEISSIQSHRDDTEPPPTDQQSDEEAPVRFGPPANEGEVGTFGRYRVLKLLGQGGMGAVYLAFDQRLARKVALKVMLPKAARNANARDRFVREARAAAQVSDDHVVAIYEADNYKGTPFIALQYLEGSPLDEFLKKKGNVSVDQAMRIGMETALGLEAAHKLGLVHRDIKPANLWLEAPKGRVKILDFGLARQASEDVNLTQSGVVIGTPAYMSPEQARGEKVDNRTDLFSLGSVLYRLTTGEMPFKGNTTMAVLTSLAVDEPFPVSQLNPKVPEALAQLIHQLLSKSADDRPRTAAAVATRLEEIQKGAANNDKPLVSKVEYVPLAVSVITEDVWAGIDDEDAPTAPPTPAKKKSTIAPVVPAAAKPKPKDSQKKPLGLMIGLAVAGLLVLAGAVAIIIKITNKDGSVTELKVPDDAKVEVNGKNVTPEKPKTTLKLDPLPPWTPPPAIAIGESPFDKLDRNAIPKEERFDWQPGELVGVIGTHARRQWGFCNALSFSPDGKLAITHHTNFAQDIAVWDVNTGSMSQSITSKNPPSHQSGTFLLKGGERLVLSGLVQSYQFFDKDGKLLAEGQLLGPDAKPINFGTSKFLCEEGKTVIVLSFDRTQIWSFAIRENSLVFIDEMKHVPASASTFFCNSPLVAKDNQLYFEDDNKLYSCSVKKGKFSPKTELAVNLPAKGSFPSAVTPDGSRLVISKMDDRSGADVWDLAGKTPKLVHQVGFGHNFNISPDGKWLVAKNSQTYLYRLDKAEPAERFLLDSTDISGGFGELQFSPDGSRLVLGNNNGFVRFWDLSGAEPREIAPCEPAKAYVTPSWLTCPQIDPRTNRLMLQTFDPPKTGQRYQLWDFAATTPRQVPSTEAPQDTKQGRIFSILQERWIQTPPANGDRAQRYELNENRWRTFGEPFGEPDTLSTVSADGRWMFQFLGTKPGEMKLYGWDVGGEPTRKWEIPVQSKRGCQFAYSQMFTSTQGSAFAVLPASEGPNELLLYRNAGAKPEMTGNVTIKNQAAQYRAAISPDGRTFAHLKDTYINDIVLEDISSGKARELKRSGEQSGLDAIHWLAFSPDGRQLAYANNNGVGVLDAKTLTPIYRWIGPGPVHWVGWAPDGRHLLTLNGNKTVYVLRLNEFTVSADRKAAEYVLSIGGTVTVRMNEQLQEIQTAQELPKLAFELTGINLLLNKKVDDAGLANFKGCENLTQLILVGGNVTDVGLAVFKDCKKLTELQLKLTHVTDVGLTYFKECKKLENVNFGQTQITDEGLKNFSDCPLKILTLHHTKISVKGLEFLKRKNDLTDLHLYDTNINDKNLAFLDDCKKIVNLNIAKTQVTAAKFEELKKTLPKCRIESDYGIYEPKP